MSIEQNAKGLYETSIDGVEYEFSVWRTRRALKTLIELSKVCGEFLARGAAMFTKPGGLSNEVNPADLAGIAEALVSGMGKDVNGTLNLIERLVTEGVSRNGKEVNFERDFERDFMHLYRVLRAALEVQYGNFFAAAKTVETQPTPTLS